MPAGTDISWQPRVRRAVCHPDPRFPTSPACSSPVATCMRCPHFSETCHCNPNAHMLAYSGWLYSFQLASRAGDVLLCGRDALCGAGFHPDNCAAEYESSDLECHGDPHPRCVVSPSNDPSSPSLKEGGWRGWWGSLCFRAD